MNLKAKGCSTPAPNLLQFRLLKYALEEYSINIEKLDPLVDHRNGIIDLQGVQIGIKYPKEYLNHISLLNHKKLYDYCFVGHFESFGRQQSLEPFIEKTVILNILLSVGKKKNMILIHNTTK